MDEVRTCSALMSNTRSAYVEHALHPQQTTHHESDFVDFRCEHKGSSSRHVDGFEWYLCSSWCLQHVHHLYHLYRETSKNFRKFLGKSVNSVHHKYWFTLCALNIHIKKSSEATFANDAFEMQRGWGALIWTQLWITNLYVQMIKTNPPSPNWDKQQTIRAIHFLSVFLSNTKGHKAMSGLQYQLIRWFGKSDEIYAA